MRPSRSPAVTALVNSPIRQPMAALTSRNSRGSRQSHFVRIQSKNALLSSAVMIRGGFLSYFGGSTSSKGSRSMIFSVSRNQWPNTMERLPMLPSTVRGDNFVSPRLRPSLDHEILGHCRGNVRRSLAVREHLAEHADHQLVLLKRARPKVLRLHVLPHQFERPSSHGIRSPLMV